MSTSKRRVVITGLGAISPLGKSVEETWCNILYSKCGITKTPKEWNKIPSKVYGKINNLEKLIEYRNIDLITKNKLLDHKYPRFVKLAVLAAAEALLESKLLVNSKNIVDNKRVGVVIGSGIGEINNIIENNKLLEHGKYSKISPFLIPNTLISSATSEVSLIFGFKGPTLSISTSCATGGHAIYIANNLIKSGECDVIICGASESSLNKFTLAGFSRCRALSRNFNLKPEKASRPFDCDRDGFVLSEGVGILVLEEVQHAKKRNARVLGELIGSAVNSDAYHVTSPDRNGTSLINAINSALFPITKSEKGISIKDVGYISAHAAGTYIGDKIENYCIKKVFQEHSSELYISSIKGAIGHSLGASGALQAIFTIKALNDNILPPTLNMNKTSTEFNLNYVPNVSRKVKELKCALVNSIGFGGFNSCSLFSSGNFGNYINK